MGTAIRNSDHEKLKALVAAHPKIGWSTRDRAGFTLLGVALRDLRGATSDIPERPLSLRVLVGCLTELGNTIGAFRVSDGLGGWPCIGSSGRDFGPATLPHHRTCCNEPPYSPPPKAELVKILSLGPSVRIFIAAP